MSSKKALYYANIFAKGYDEYILQRSWHGPEFLFALMHKNLCKGQKLLDIGIGTGLSSLPFHKAGLKIYGIDGSEEMLSICRNKNFAVELCKFDLTKNKFPFMNETFNHVISYGVFHIVGKIEKTFRQVNIRLSQNGFFAFSIDEYLDKDSAGYFQSRTRGIFEKINEQSGIMVYKHSDDYIRCLAENNGFAVVNKKTIPAFKETGQNREVPFSIFLLQKINGK